MTNTNITSARKNLFQLADSCIKYNDIVNINTKSGNVVMLSEEDYRGMLETMHLCSIPGMKESIIEGMKTPTEELEGFSWDD